MAYIVCHAAGLSNDYSLPYLAVWAGGDSTTIRSTAERVLGRGSASTRADSAIRSRKRLRMSGRQPPATSSDSLPYRHARHYLDTMRSSRRLG